MNRAHEGWGSLSSVCKTLGRQPAGFCAKQAGLHDQRPGLGLLRTPYACIVSGVLQLVLERRTTCTFCATCSTEWQPCLEAQPLSVWVLAVPCTASLESCTCYPLHQSLSCGLLTELCLIAAEPGRQEDGARRVSAEASRAALWPVGLPERQWGVHGTAPIPSCCAGPSCCLLHAAPCLVLLLLPLLLWVF